MYAQKYNMSSRLREISYSLGCVCSVLATFPLGFPFGPVRLYLSIHYELIKLHGEVPYLFYTMRQILSNIFSIILGGNVFMQFSRAGSWRSSQSPGVRYIPSLPRCQQTYGKRNPPVQYGSRMHRGRYLLSKSRFPIRFLEAHKDKIITNQNRALHQHAVRCQQRKLLLLAHSRQLHAELHVLV